MNGNIGHHVAVMRDRKAEVMEIILDPRNDLRVGRCRYVDQPPKYAATGGDVLGHAMSNSSASLAQGRRAGVSNTRHHAAMRVAAF